MIYVYSGLKCYSLGDDLLLRYVIRIRIRNIYLRSDTNLTGNTSGELLTDNEEK